MAQILIEKNIRETHYLSKFLVMNVADSRWNDIVFSSVQYDFYHTQSYHLFEKENEAVLFVYFFDDNFIALPLVIRSIPGSDLKDCTSVYGYCGPIGNIKFNNLPSEVVKQFNVGLNSFFIERKIVSSFHRLHPLFPSQEILFKDFGEILILNKTVAIDLNLTAENHWSNYRKSTRVHIKRALESGITVRRTSDSEDLERFIDIYYENMQRVNADSRYYFSRDYFQYFMNSSDFRSVLLVAEKDGEIIAGVIVTICNGVMQVHLSGTQNEMLNFSPMKLLFDRARVYANEMRCTYCHLGGGYGNQNDSLFKFKTNFSKDFFEFKVWKKIVNMKAYNELVTIKFGDKMPSSDFFPLYRL